MADEPVVVPYVYIDPGTDGINLRLAKSSRAPIERTDEFHEVTRTFGNEASARGNVGAWNWATEFLISSDDLLTLKARVQEAKTQVNRVTPYGRIVVYNFLEKFPERLPPAIGNVAPDPTRLVVPSQDDPNPHLDTPVLKGANYRFTYYIAQQGFIEYQELDNDLTQARIKLSFIETEIKLHGSSV